MKRSKVKRMAMRDLKGWRSCFDLDGWNIDAEFAHLDGERVACCDADWRYMEATLTFDLDYLASMGDADEIRASVRKAVVHELLHMVCSGYQQHHTIDHLERMVTTLTTIVFRCREAPETKG